MSDDDDFSALCETLREEASEQVDRIGTVLVEIEGDRSSTRARALLDEAFRQAHNLKGAAGSLGFPLAARLAHGIESALAEIRRAPGADSSDLFDLIHRGLTLVPTALSATSGSETHPEVSPLVEQLLAVSTSLRPARRAAAPEERTAVELPQLRTGFSDPPRTTEGEPTTGARQDADKTSGDVPWDAPQPARTTASGGIPDPGREPVALRDFTPVGTRAAIGEAATMLRAPDQTPTAPDQAPPGPPEASLSGIDEAPAALARGEETLRVSTKKLGALMAQVGELLAARLRTDQRLAEIRAILATEEDIAERRSALRATIDDLGLARDPVTQRLRGALGEAIGTHKDLVRRLRDLVRAFEADALHSTILSGELQEDIRRIQTFPLSSVLGPLPRAVRNMARDAGKDVELVTHGGGLELDKKVLEALRDPLYHLLRNAVDHGVEPADERRRAGKPERGQIVLSAEHRGDAITITIEDDGPGVDLDAVRRRARERGLLTEAQAMEASEQLLLDFLFSAGFTTRRKVGNLSGRGVGLDAVRTGIEALRGSVSVQTRRGRGTLVAIRLPLTIYVVHALVLRVGRDELALPISSVQRILRVRPADVLIVEQSPAILVDDRPVALIPLASLLGLKADDKHDGDPSSVVVLGVGDQRCALVVDEIVGDQTVLAKNLEPPLVRVPNIAGATIRGDGSVLLALSPVDLLRKAGTIDAERGSLGLGHASQPRRARVLLVDDSFTTRALERGVLEAAGFDVVAVASGEEALAVLADAQAFDAVVSDVLMPGIDGFELCRKIRSDPRWRALPVLLVTSLASQGDRTRGLDAGADAYVAKADFDHEDLVSRIRALVGRP